MIAAKEQVKQQGKEYQDRYFLHFAELEKRRAGKEPSWLQTIRRAAFERFVELGFPTARNEEWKYTSVAPIVKTLFRPAADYLAPVSVRQPREYDAERFAPYIPLHFYNGRFVEELIPTAALPSGVKVSSLAQALRVDSGLLEKHLARYASYENQAFVAMNTAFMEDGAYIEIAKDVVLDRPIFLSYGAGPSNEPIIYHPRNLIIVGQSSQATVFEQYCSESKGAANLYFTNAVTEVSAGENARLEYIKEQHESNQAFHIATLQLQQQRSSSVSTTSLAFGSAVAREDVIAVLGGPGAECSLNGLYLTSGAQHVDNHTTIDHAQPHCSSRELYKGVLDGKSTGVFNGKIVVRKDAQKTDSKQSNKNLLLSEGCTINTKPQLEISADDVKCTHGATIGQIDAEAVFYLRSRGIALEEARSMLTVAFANDVIGKIKFEPLRARLQKAVVENLGKKREAEAKSEKSEERGAQGSTMHQAR